MSTITTYSQFTGAVGIANSDPSKAEGQQLQNFIEKYENEFFDLFFGYEFKQLFLDGIDLMTAKYTAIRDGSEYTDAAGRLAKWEGLTGYSPVVNYIYFHLLNHKRTQTGNIGEVIPAVENGQAVSPYHKQIRAWNEMVGQCWSLHEFLRLNEADYPEYFGLVASPYFPNPYNANYQLFQTINEFNI